MTTQLQIDLPHYEGKLKINKDILSFKIKLLAIGTLNL